MTWNSRQFQYHFEFYAGTLEQSMGARNQAGIGLSYRPVRLHTLLKNAEENYATLTWSDST
jgi:hypothetical protein